MHESACLCFDKRLRLARRNSSTDEKDGTCLDKQTNTVTRNKIRLSFTYFFDRPKPKRALMAPHILQTPADFVRLTVSPAGLQGFFKAAAFSYDSRR